MRNQKHHNSFSKYIRHPHSQWRAFIGSKWSYFDPAKNIIPTHQYIHRSLYIAILSHWQSFKISTFAKNREFSYSCASDAFTEEASTATDQQVVPYCMHLMIVLNSVHCGNYIRLMIVLNLVYCGRTRQYWLNCTDLSFLLNVDCTHGDSLAVISTVLFTATDGTRLQWRRR